MIRHHRFIVILSLSGALPCVHISIVEPVVRLQVDSAEAVSINSLWLSFLYFIAFILLTSMHFDLYHFALDVLSKYFELYRGVVVPRISVS